MLYGKYRSYTSGLVAALCLVASTAHAAPFDVMAIGDSLTNGFAATESSTGWIEPLRNGDLNNADDAVNSFSFIGTQGSGDFRHEGYNSYGISLTEELDKGLPGNINDSLGFGVSDINPSNADIVMLLIGTNGARSGAGGTTSVTNLSALIDTIMTTYLTNADQKLLVSTLPPVAYQRKRFNSGLFDGDNDPVGDLVNDPENTGIREFNQKLLDVFTGTGIGNSDGTWDTGTYSSGTIAEHQNYEDRVFLLDLNSAFGDEPSESLFFTGNNDYLHFSAAGNQLVADFYTDRYFELGLQQVPTPTSAATLLVLMGMGLARRRRRAA